MKIAGKCILILTIIYFLAEKSNSQDFTSKSAEILSWTVLQVVPSPVFIQDANENNARVQFALRWQVTPLSISFRSNKYVSPFQFFKINPVHRFTGSMEFFVQPEWTTSSFKYSNFARFGLGAGSRILIPLKGDGETSVFSLGAKYNYRKDFISGNNGFWGIEAGIYAVYGVLGLQFNYNFDKRSRFNAGIFFKYF